jgi:hypothetical protein
MGYEKLSDEIERQREEQRQYGWSPVPRALTVGALTILIVALLMTRSQMSDLANGALSFGSFARDFMVALLIGAVIASFVMFGAWAGACQARYKKWSSSSAWVAAVIGGIAPYILFALLALLAGIVNSWFS